MKRGARCTKGGLAAAKKEEEERLSISKNGAPRLQLPRPPACSCSAPRLQLLRPRHTLSEKTRKRTTSVHKEELTPDCNQLYAYVSGDTP
jgi:hypothetical protein